MLLSGDPGADPGTAGQTEEAGAAGAALVPALPLHLPAAGGLNRWQAASPKPPGLVTFSLVSASELQNCS